MKIKFSIVIPVYNSERFFEDCLVSIFNQDYDNYELLIVDDGSTDNTSSIYNKYKNDKRIKIIKQKNMGVSYARLAGVKAATGDYLVFCDSDDMFYSKTLSRLSSIINKYTPDIINFNTTSVRDGFLLNDSGKYYNRKEIEDYIFPFLLEDKNGKYFPNQVCCAAFKRKIYEDNQVVDKKIAIGEDLACKKAALFNANSLYMADDIFYYYRRNEYSATLSKKAFPWDGPELLAKHLEEKIDIESFDFRNQLNRVITHQLFLVVLSQFNKKEKYSNIKQEILNNLNNQYYKEAISNCKYSLKHFKGSLAKFLLKNKMIFFMYLVAKIY